MLTHCNKNQLLIVMSTIQRLKPCDENPLFNNTVEINFVNHALININWMFIIVMSTIQRSASFITYIISYCSFKRDAIDPCDENPLFITQWSDVTQNYATRRHQWGVSVFNTRPYMIYLNRHFRKKIPMLFCKGMICFARFHVQYAPILFYFIIPIAATVAKLTTDQASCNVAKIWDSSMFTKMHQNCFFVKNNKKCLIVQEWYENNMISILHNHRICFQSSSCIQTCKISLTLVMRCH